MSDDDIGTRFGHGNGLLGSIDIDDAEEVHASSERDHFKLLLHAHARLFENLAELAIDDAVGGEIVHATEAHVFDLAQPMPHAAAGIGGMDAADHGDFVDDGQHFKFTDLHGDGIRIAIRHETSGRAVTRHAVAAGIVNDDQIRAAFFNELRADARASSSGNDRFAFAKGVVQSIQHLRASVGISNSCPWVRHSEKRYLNYVPMP